MNFATFVWRRLGSSIRWELQMRGKTLELVEMRLSIPWRAAALDAFEMALC